MNPATSENGVIFPTDLQRKQIFYWLQKVSSLTAWRRIFEHYQAWADATENGVAEAEMRGWSDISALKRRDLLMVKKGLADFEKCAVRLTKNGNRKFRAIANFSPTSAQQTLLLEAQLVRRVDEGENGINEEHTPLWQEYCEAMTSFRYVWMECTMHIFTSYDFRSEYSYYSKRLEEELAHMPFPAQLSAVPEPTEDVIIRANGWTPFAGIWEPVEAPERTFLSRFSSAWKPSAPFKILGAMCYFETHSRAPRLSVDTPDGMKKLDMAWRLLWRDDRYSDGATPEIESTYRFMYPDRSLAKRSTDGDGDVIWAESGAAAQSDGNWMLEGSPGFGIMRKRGQRMPFSQGESGRWILQQEGCLATTETASIGEQAD